MDILPGVVPILGVVLVMGVFALLAVLEERRQRRKP